MGYLVSWLFKIGKAIRTVRTDWQTQWKFDDMFSFLFKLNPYFPLLRDWNFSSISNMKHLGHHVSKRKKKKSGLGKGCGERGRLIGFAGSSKSLDPKRYVNREVVRAWFPHLNAFPVFPLLIYFFFSYFFFYASSWSLRDSKILSSFHPTTLQ
jgi:hypothetical protein